MAKVLLVEDDTNLREIFEMRLQAEGYETLTAGDGEQALAVAMKEKPDLIVADVMMPHLSGFEMIETLRAAPDMADTKVVMMTALGQAEDQARGEKLGVVKYLVKSQVTLEDFARIIREVLPPEGKSTPKINQESEKTMQDDKSTNPAPAADPMGAAPADDPATTGQQSTADEQADVNAKADAAMASTPVAPAAADEPKTGAPATDGGASQGDVSMATPPPADDAEGDKPADQPPATGDAGSL